MNILSALKSDASKLQKQLGTLNSAIKISGGTNTVGRGKRRSSARARASIGGAQRARWAREKSCVAAVSVRKSGGDGPTK